MTTTPRTRKSDITRALGRILGKDSRSAAHGWDVYDNGNNLIITLNYNLRTSDRKAFEELQDSTFGQRYRLIYTPALIGDDYEHMPAEFENCGVIDFIRRDEPTPTATPATQEAPAVTAEPTVTLSLPGKFCDWLDGTNLAQGMDDADPDCKATREAYSAGTLRRTPKGYSIKITTGDTTVLNVLREYADTCIDSNLNGEPDAAEVRAARTVIERATAARKTLKAAQHLARETSA